MRLAEPTVVAWSPMELERILSCAGELDLEVGALREVMRRGVEYELAPGVTPDDGGVRLGGAPRLPPDVRWPTARGRSLAFVAQLDLTRQPAALARAGFPEQGLLTFFFANGGGWGFEPSHAEDFAVIYVPDPSAAVERPLPSDLPERARYAPCRAVRARETWCLPPAVGAFVTALDLSDADLDAYDELAQATCELAPYAGRLLAGGHPDPIQGDLMVQCALVTGGITGGPDDDEARIAELTATADDWQLLLQVPSHEGAGMSWVDGGCLYYAIRAQDLRERRFRNAWLVLQCL